MKVIGWIICQYNITRSKYERRWDYIGPTKRVVKGLYEEVNNERSFKEDLKNDWIRLRRLYEK